MGKDTRLLELDEEFVLLSSRLDGAVPIARRLLKLCEQLAVDYASHEARISFLEVAREEANAPMPCKKCGHTMDEHRVFGKHGSHILCRSCDSMVCYGE